MIALRQGSCFQFSIGFKLLGYTPKLHSKIMITGWRICGFLWMTFFVIWMIAALFTKRSVERVSWERGLRYGIPVVIGYYLMFSRKLDIAWLQNRLLPHSEALDISAVLITIAGMLFAVWARIYLGRNWSSAPMIREQHELIRSGPYRLVRHPIYTGILLAMVGTFLANGKVRGLLAVLFVWWGWTIKSRIEEEFMLRTFGPQYEEYRRTTGALLPKVRS